MERKDAWRFSKNDYVLTDMENMKVIEEKDGVTTEYSIDGGSGIEKKLLYTNPDTSVQMSTDTMFMESEIEGYQYLCFTVTDTSNSYEIEEWCEIAPLKERAGQFVISQPLDGKLYYRKVYRSSGAVKPSVNVYEVGKTTEDRNTCIIKTVECIKGV